MTQGPPVLAGMSNTATEIVPTTVPQWVSLRDALQVQEFRSWH